MIKLYEIFYNDFPVAFVKERINGTYKCQRYSFSETIPDISFIVPTPVYDKFKTLIRTDNKNKTIKSLIKKLVDELNQTNLSLNSINQVLKRYIDVGNNSQPIFKIVTIVND